MMATLLKRPDAFAAPMKRNTMSSILRVIGLAAALLIVPGLHAQPAASSPAAGSAASANPASAAAALATVQAPDEFIRLLSQTVLDRIRQEPDLRAGDLRRVSRFVDESVMPYVDFERMTALAVGRGWRQASPEQQRQLMAEFRVLLVRTYAGAVSHVKDQQIRLKPQRPATEDGDAIVRSEIVSTRGEPIQIDYRMSRTPSGWKIYDLNVLGVWLVESYRNQFAQEVSAKGIDGLIRSLSERNRQFAQAKP